ncbi:MAG: SAM-dependent methyltransferase [Lachnospiraceae bacterium]|nr:SAM-dependent methyltransferase [Robinsoniella sp.]MDY3765582.1 SAM-dependent methyltransferase [Lachnospiraceae bacterium]
MEKIRKVLDEQLDENLLQIVLSGKKHTDVPGNRKIRPIMKKDHLFFQVSLQDGKKEFHENYKKEEMKEKICQWMEQDYKQMQLESTQWRYSAMVSKKGQVTVKGKRQEEKDKPDLNHNRPKRYILEEGIRVPFLEDLGVMTMEGKIVKSRYDKFRQINRFLEFIEDILPQLNPEGELTVIDFGCGKSYLTFAIYYYLHELKNRDVRIIGLDLKEDVIETCSRLAEKYGYEKLKFLVGDIASYEGVSQVDLVVTLHACDTATDYALAKAVSWNAKAILSVPCCQHELNGQIQCQTLEPILKYGLIKERIAALMTDALRADCLETAGYHVQVLEFIDMEHTPKNILIRAVKTGQKTEKKDMKRCMEFLGVSPLLPSLLEQKETKV